MPLIDPRTKRDIVEHITAIAPYYAPEWRFDPDHPDAGAAVALIFASMFEGTIQRFNQVPQKYYIDFLNRLNISPLPPVAAEGYATLQTHPEQEGVYIPAGFQLFADSDDRSQRVVFETVHDIQVTPAKTQAVFAVHPQRGIVNRLNLPAPLFHFDETLNGQKDTLHLCDSRILDVGEGGTVKLVLSHTKDPAVSRRLLRHLADSQKTDWFFHAPDRRVPFETVEISDACLLLTLPRNQRIGKTVFNGVDSCWIGCQTHPFSAAVTVDRILAASENKNLPPQHMICRNMAFSGDSCQPFGERYALLDDFYLIGDEVFSKKGAAVQISFKLIFSAVSMAPAIEPPPEPEWKPIMKKSAFKKTKRPKTWISKVAWEYWNGYGWAALPVPKEAETVFSKTSNNGYRLITFMIPEDIQKSFINAYFCYGIRLRILEIENPHPHDGYCMAPKTDHIRLYYNYPQPVICPEKAMLCRHQSVTDISEPCRAGDPVRIFEALTDTKPALYLYFTQPPVGGPLRFLFDIAPRSHSETIPELLWEYLSNPSDPSGSPEFKPLPAADQTDHLNAAGLFTFEGPNDFAQGTFFGLEGYWIRAMDIYGYSNRFHHGHAVLKGIYENTVHIVNREPQKDLFFHFKPDDSPYICRLLNPPIIDAQVWVNEIEGFNPQQFRDWDARDLRQVSDEAGHIIQRWVRWQARPDFIASGPEDRHYVLEPNEGLICFGDGVHGKIPPFSSADNILVHSAATSGEAGNLPPFRLNRLSGNKGFISRVFNLLPIAGGSAQEPLEAALKRGGARLSHRNRAVSARDYENLALETSQNIARVKCFSSVNVRGEKEPGQVTLVLLHRDYDQDPGAFTRIRNQVFQALQSKCDPLLLESAAFNIIEPHYMPVSVQLEVMAAHPGERYSIQDLITREIRRFLDPLTGNFDGRGWDIGEMPTKAQIYHYIKSAAGLLHIEKILAWTKDADIDQTVRMPFALPVNGAHHAVVTIGG